MILTKVTADLKNPTSGQIPFQGTVGSFADFMRTAGFKRVSHKVRVIGGLFLLLRACHVAALTCTVQTSGPLETIYIRIYI
jgi:hypothetical protein